MHYNFLHCDIVLYIVNFSVDQLYLQPRDIVQNEIFSAKCQLFKILDCLPFSATPSFKKINTMRFAQDESLNSEVLLKFVLPKLW